MSQDNKSSNRDEQKRQVESGREENGVGTKAAEARIWAAANKLTRDGKVQFPEKQE